MTESNTDLLYPDHRWYCTDSDPNNADPGGSHGCERCTALALDKLAALEARHAGLAAAAAWAVDAIDALSDRRHCYPEDAEIVSRELHTIATALKAAAAPTDREP